tara:strand:- start:72 stop:788 length:717 start_codon:yes stop_codon:yes gene_type:complete
LFTTVDAVCVIVLVSLVLFYRKSVSTTNSFAYDESSGTVWIIQNAAGRQIAMGALAVPPNRAIASVPTPGGSVGVPPDLEAMISYPFGYVDKFEGRAFVGAQELGTLSDDDDRITVISGGWPVHFLYNISFSRNEVSSFRELYDIQYNQNEMANAEGIGISFFRLSLISAVVAVPLSAFFFSRAAIRLRSEKCVACAYSMRGIGPICPECGYCANAKRLNLARPNPVQPKASARDGSG